MQKWIRKVYKGIINNRPRILTLLSILFELFALLIGALTFGNDREMNAEVVAIRFVLRGACDTYKKTYSHSNGHLVNTKKIVKKF